MGIFLEEFEVYALTGRVRYSAQARALRAMSVEHMVRPDGRPIVLRAHIEVEMGYPKRRGRLTKGKWTPDLAAAE